MASVNAQLNGLTYTPADGFVGFTTLTVVTNDQGNTGTGGPLSDTDLVQIEVVAVVRPRARPDTIPLTEGAGPFVLPNVMGNDLGNLIPGDPEGDQYPTTLEAVGTAEALPASRRLARWRSHLRLERRCCR